ncbi:MAG: GNAT family N-acetyltransferase, partial [Candidatus Margulisiibacteriota bacterium]
NIKKLYFDFILSNFGRALLLLAKKLRLSIIKSLFETVFYPAQRQTAAIPSAEFLSISVEKDFRGLGISDRLFELVVAEFKKRNISKFKIVVGSNLLQAQRFYEKMGCGFVSEIEVHKGEKSKFYIYNIKTNENTTFEP